LRIDPTDPQHTIGIDFDAGDRGDIVTAVPTAIATAATSTTIAATALSEEKRGDQQRGAKRHPDMGKPTQMESAIHGSQSSNRDQSGAVDRRSSAGKNRATGEASRCSKDNQHGEGRQRF
jgi:hypothetical protein